MKTFFTSDTHFDHDNIIKFCDRPFKDVNHMNEQLVERWNSVVGEKDLVYHLGDILFGGPSKLLEMVKRLNGNKVFITGNHDKHMNKLAEYYPVFDYLETKVEGQHICLFHYPILEWHWAGSGSWHLHGHCHANLKHDPHSRRLDVGVDNPLCDYTPISFEQVGKYMDDIKPRIPIDHHGR